MHSWGYYGERTPFYLAGQKTAAKPMSGSTLSTSETVAGSSSTKASSACSEVEPQMEPPVPADSGVQESPTSEPPSGEPEPEYGADPRCNNLFAIF
jgi:hypothetical protein